MILIDNYSQVTAQIETERGISKEDLGDAIKQALVAACRKKHSEEAQLYADLNPLTGEAHIWLHRTVVETIENEGVEVAMQEAQKVQPGIALGEELRENVTPADFGRLAAQAAKQVIVQRIRESEKELIFKEFSEKVGTLIIGTIQKVEGRSYLINLGRIESLLPGHEQIPGERYQVKDKIRLYLDGIVKTPRGPVIKVSRAHQGLLRCLFHLEVPEIAENIIEIKSISREAGKRSKVAVISHNPSIGAVGTCVGHMGGRIQSIIKEIGNEKIDILEWHEEPSKFIANALKPAKISHVKIEDEDAKKAVVIVKKDELSLAIGKFGVNVRLAAKLTGWNLDILDEDSYEDQVEDEKKKSHISIIDRIQKDKEEMDLAEKALEMTEVVSEVASVKVSELAKSLKMKTVDLIEEAKVHGIEIKSNRSALTEEVAAQLKTCVVDSEASES